MKLKERDRRDAGHAPRVRPKSMGEEIEAARTWSDED
jgi:hypothetical protein